MKVEEAAGWEVEGEREHKGGWNTNIDVPVSSPRTTEMLCPYGAHMGTSMQQPVAGCCSTTRYFYRIPRRAAGGYQFCSTKEPMPISIL